MTQSLSDHQLQAALQAVETSAASAAEKLDMLVELAMGVQQQARDGEQLQSAISLYEQALALCGTDELIRARIRARRATALQMMPGAGSLLREALDELQVVRPVLAASGTAAETAECDLNIGLVHHSLGESLSEAIAAYQRALRVFRADKHPREYAILHSNLATAYLAMPLSGEAGQMREALAVQSFEAALKVVNLIDHPREYAMLQNNLGNALQYAGTGHPLDNNLRALDAYREALKVRTADNTPGEYANTLANMANCLLNLPDDSDQPDRGNPENQNQAQALYREARQLFAQLGEYDKLRVVDGVLAQWSQHSMETAMTDDDHGR